MSEVINTDNPIGTSELQRCISLAQGNISQDLRVNYTYGLVMGVDEFIQEQTYFLHKEYMHNRGLHGYGTISGLDVNLSTLENGDVQIAVSSGAGIDQCGRTFIIRNEQCAFLRPWLVRQASLTGENEESRAITPGSYRLYVVATYAETKDALVSIAGQPCGPSGLSHAPSRIRDCFNIALRWDKPDMPAWDAILCFADLMRQVRVVPDLTPEESDKTILENLVGMLPDCVAIQAILDDRAAEGSSRLLLAENTAREDLDDLFRLWVTDIRPHLLPDLLNCDPATVETGIVLGHFDIDLLADTTASVPSFSLVTPLADDNERPYLLSTQVIQEMLLLGGGDARAVREFGSLHVVNSNEVLMWLYHEDSIALPSGGSFADGMKVLSNGISLTGSVIALTDFPNLYLISTNENIPANARVEVRLGLDNILVNAFIAREAITNDVNISESTGEEFTELMPLPEIRRSISTGEEILIEERDTTLRADELAMAEGGTTLLSVIDSLPYDYIGHEGSTLVLRTFADTLPDVLPFVSVTTTGDGTRGGMSLWFHVPENTEIRPNGEFAINDVLTVTLNEEDIQIPASDGSSDSNIWLLSFAKFFRDGDRLTMSFDARLIQLVNEETGLNMSLLDWMIDNQQAFLGFDGQVIWRHHIHSVDEVRGSSGGLTEAQVRAIVDDVINSVRTVPFVNITLVGTDNELTFDFELWFHPDFALHLDTNSVKIEPIGEDELGPIWPIYAYIELNTGGVVEIQVVNIVEDPGLTGGRRYFLRLNLNATDEFGGGKYIRFGFDLNQGIGIENSEGSFGTLNNYIRGQHVKFDGYLGISVSKRVGDAEVLKKYERISETDIQIAAEKGPLNEVLGN